MTDVTVKVKPETREALNKLKKKFNDDSVDATIIHLINEPPALTVVKFTPPPLPSKPEPLDPFLPPSKVDIEILDYLKRDEARMKNIQDKIAKLEQVYIEMLAKLQGGR